MLESNGASVVAPKFEDFSQNTANGSGSNSKYIRSGRNNPCPVCDRVKDGDCSWYSDGRTVMCKSYVDGTGHDESKWHYTGVNELGFQGKFVLKQEREFVKARRPKDRKDYYYPNRDGSSLVKVTRTDDGNGNKKFSQSHWDGNKWLNSNPEHIKRLVPIYRYQDVRARRATLPPPCRRRMPSPHPRPPPGSWTLRHGPRCRRTSRAAGWRPTARCRPLR